MFYNCSSLNTIVCLANSGFNTSSCLNNWVKLVPSSGTFVKSSTATSWTTGISGIPSGWTVVDDIYAPTIFCDGENIHLTCTTEGSEIYYRLDQTGEFQLYSQPIAISQDTLVEAYSTLGTHISATVSDTCVYVQ